MSGTCGKGFLYFYNLIFLGISGALMYLAVLFVWKFGDYSSLAANTYSIVPVGIIFAFGIVVFIAAIVGLCGTCNESRCTLGVFFSLLLVILTMEIVAGSLTYLKKQQIETDVKHNLWQSFEQYYDEHSTSKKPFDKMQHHLKCCGVNNITDWSTTSPSKIPDSCCIHQDKMCYALPNNLYTTGCFNELILMLNNNLRYIMGVVIGFAVFQVMGMMLSIYLIVVFKRNGYMRIIDSSAKT